MPKRLTSVERQYNVCRIGLVGRKAQWSDCRDRKSQNHKTNQQHADRNPQYNPEIVEKPNCQAFTLIFTYSRTRFLLSLVTTSNL